MNQLLVPLGQALINESSKVYMPLTVLGELQFGALNSGNPELKFQQLQTFLNSVELVTATTKNSLCYVELKLELRKRGTPVPENDIWIAAHGKELGVPVITKDRHFAAFLTIETISPLREV